MKANTAFVPNKKLILHFDVHEVLCLPDGDKDFYVESYLFRCMSFALIGYGVSYSVTINKILI